MQWKNNPDKTVAWLTHKEFPCGSSGVVECMAKITVHVVLQNKTKRLQVAHKC